MPISRNPNRHTHELPGARFTSLATPTRGSRTTSVWRVELTPGTPGTPHELTDEEVFVVLEGRAKVRLAADTSEAGPGDCIIVPPNTPFSLEAVGASTFAAICCLPVGGRARLPDGKEFAPPWSE
jgi:mannose-6-phosphate isomerase-like protein (cupin superfamily)